MCFLSEDDNSLKKYNDIWNGASNIMKKEFNSEPICNKRYPETKINFYGNEVTDFHNKKVL